MSNTPPLAHIVYFTLNDSSDEKKAELIRDCKEYLSNHEGQDYFAAGTLNPDLSRPVNDKSYDVSLHTYFANREAHDAYQVHARHTEFIERNKANWKQVRVFDSDLG